MAKLIAAHAWLPQGWQRDVLLEWDAAGTLLRVQAGAQDADAERSSDILIPGIANLHSHAFQRAMAGLTETRAAGEESFWSWRTRMYAFAARLDPVACKAIAVQLYVEMLKAGYTSVCEFHYLHHDRGGKPYAPFSLLAQCIVEAAAESGIGLTLLPVLYQYSGLGQRAPLAEQARFINAPDALLSLIEDVRAVHPEHGGLRYGVAPHSLRAVDEAGLRAVLAGLPAGTPVHIHIAEQQKEVEDCRHVLGAPPVAWLLDQFDVDARWCLVHATHMDGKETRALAASGAVAGICPSTETNLGDGLFNALPYLAEGGRFGIGSDSHVTVCPFEELRLFEYGQRLRSEQRNMLAPVSGGSVAAHLLRGAVAGGAQASGRAVNGLAVGQRADFLLLDAAHPDLAEKSGDAWLDSMVFGRHGASPLHTVYAGGRRVVHEGRHQGEGAAAAAYRAALRTLLA